MSYYSMCRNVQQILSSRRSSAVTATTYSDSSPILWVGDDRDLDIKLGPRDVEVEIAPPTSDDISGTQSSANLSASMASQRGRTESKKRLQAGAHRSLTSNSLARKASVESFLRKPSRREGRLAVVDDEFGTWSTKDFINPRPPPAPPLASSFGYHPHVIPYREILTRPSAYRDVLSVWPMADGVVLSSKRSGKVSNGTLHHPSLQQPTPIEPVRPLFIHASSPAIPKQKPEVRTIPLPTISSPVSSLMEPMIRACTSSAESVDSSMDCVHIQIQDCIIITERMDEALSSCSYVQHYHVIKLCAELKTSLRDIQETIDDGSSCVELDTSEKSVWGRKHESLEASVEKNVRKYYQLATQTARKPPRVNRMDQRMEKLEAYLRKFRNLNNRILALYDTLRILELHARLVNAHADARRRRSEETRHKWESKHVSKMEKKALSQLKDEFRAACAARQRHLDALRCQSYPDPFSPLTNLTR